MSVSMGGIETAPTLRRPERYGEWAALAAIFLLFSNAVVVAVGYHGLPRAGAFTIIPLLLALPLFVGVVMRGERLRLTTTFFWAVFYAVVQFVGCLLSRDPIESMERFVVSVSEGLVLYLLVSNALRTESMVRRAVWALLTAGALMGALVGYQQVTRSFDHEFLGFAQIGADVGHADEGTVQQVRLAGPVGEVNAFAQFMSMLIPLALFALPSARTRMGKLLVASAMGFSMLAAMLAFSRGIAVGLVLTFLVMACLGTVRLKHVLLAGLVVAVALAAVPQYGKRLGSLVNLSGLVSGSGADGIDSSSKGRLTEMLAAGLVFVDHPVFGAGPGMSRILYREYGEIVGGRLRPGARMAHSLYLQIAAEHGMLGLLAFGGMVVAAFVELQRARRRLKHSNPELSLLATGLMMSLVVYLTTGMFLHAAYIRYFWLFLGIAGAAGCVLGTENSDQTYSGSARDAYGEPAR
jgi:putative inorganic carbon (HCO3(-)) transporter